MDAQSVCRDNDIIDDVEFNVFKRLDILKYKKGNNHIYKKELINPEFLQFIVYNKNLFKGVIEKEYGSKYDPFLMAKRYLKEYNNQCVDVKYKQYNKVGRYYADKGLSLQGLPRNIRQTICSEYYVDIDIENCHPSILRHICNVYNIECPILSSYVDNRKKFLEENNVDKTTIIKLINGNKSEMKKNNVSDTLWEFYNDEILRIRDGIISIHMDAYLKHISYRNNVKKKPYNYRGSFLSIVMSDYESQILNALLSFFGDDENAVLCFDGLMLKKGEYDIKGAEKMIYDKFNINLKIKVKPFNEIIDMSRFNILPYVKYNTDNYDDYREFVNKTIYKGLFNEWVYNCIYLIDNHSKTFLITKNMDTDIVSNEKSIKYQEVYAKELIQSLDVYCNISNPLYSREKNNEYNELNKKNKAKYEDMDMVNEYHYRRIGSKDGALTDIICSRMLKKYTSIDFYPYLKRNGEPNMHGKFNNFTGFPMDNLELDNTLKDFEDSLLYKHIRDELMDGNIGEFNHFLDHIADMVQDPVNIKGNAHLFYTRQGMGKGMLGVFMTNLLGQQHVISIGNIDNFFGRFNCDQVHKILKIFEEVSDKGGAIKNHDLLKDAIVKDTERIEPKGINPYPSRHCARHWFYTNNENAIFVEGDDRRFTVHKANNRYANNLEYFKPIWDEVRNIAFCRKAFEFFATRKYETHNVLRPFENKFKIEQKKLNMPLGLKFIIDFVENNFYNLNIYEDKIMARDFHGAFKTFCDGNGYRYHTGSFKTQIKKINMIPSRMRFEKSTLQCYKVGVEDLTINFRKFLKDDTFKFEIGEDECDS